MKDYKKKYEDALNATRKFKNDYPSLWNIESNPFKGVFEELEEDSNGDKIRKELIHFFKNHVDSVYEEISDNNVVIAWLEKQEQKLIRPIWKYKKDHTPLLRDSFILNKYGCVGKSPSGALVSDVWVLDFDELAKLPKEEIEKQDEQKPTDKIEPKFKVGDWVTNGINFTFKVMSIKDDMYYRDDNYFIDIKTADKTFRLWTIQDAKDGDVLVTLDDKCRPFIYKGCLDHDYPNFPVAYCGIDITGNLYTSAGRFNFRWTDKEVQPATKKQRDIFFQKMHEAGYEWDSEKKELKEIQQKYVDNQFIPKQANVLDKHIDKFLEQKPEELPKGEDYGIDSLYHAARILEKTLGEVDGYQSDDGILEHKCAIEAVNRLYKQQPAWSEEDKKMCQETIDWFEKKCFPYALESENPARESIKWLKSLKDRVQPQPKQEWSEEDKNLLNRLIGVLDGTNKEDYHEAWEEKFLPWLKSLKERMKGE